MINSSDSIWENTRTEGTHKVIELNEDMDKYEMLSLFFHKETIKIDRDDNIKVSKAESKRYFGDTTVCYTCCKTGHSSRDCDAERRRNCAYCGTYHLGKYCELTFCNNCHNFGHKEEQCREKKVKNYVCKACPLQYHTERDCPKKWRKYKIENNYVSKKFKMSCAYCCQDDHFIDDCKYKNIKMSIFTKNYTELFKKG